MPSPGHAPSPAGRSQYRGRCAGPGRGGIGADGKRDQAVDCGVLWCYKLSNLCGEVTMDSDNLWVEVRQLTSVGFWRDVTAAWLVVGVVFALLFIK